MKAAVIGSRKRSSDSDMASVKDLIYSFNQRVCVVSGGCRGVDTWAENFAKERGLKVVVHRPNIRKEMDYSSMVDEYYRRNRLIVDDADVVYAFVDVASPHNGGTAYTVDYARKSGKPVVIL